MRNLALDTIDKPRSGTGSPVALPRHELEVVPRPAERAVSRPSIRIPRIVIQAFCETSDVATVLERAAADRLMARARMSVAGGGIAGATDFYRGTPTPNLIIVEAQGPNQIVLAELDRLAEVCDTGTKVMVIGHSNDISHYRELMRRGICEYVLAPIGPVSIIDAIGGIYGEAAPRKLGQVYAFIGAKGGVGSSTLAHNVGWTIARRLGSDVVLADLDLPFGTASLDFNLDVNQGVAEAIQDAGRLDEVLLDRLLTKCGDHLSLLAAPAILSQPYDLGEAAIEPLLEVAQASVPFLILDMPHLWTSWARNTLVSADEVLITAAPDLANLRNAKSIVDFLKQARPNDPPPKLVLNQVGMPRRPEIKPSEFAKALQIEPVASLPFDAHLFGTAANNGKMIAETSSKAAVPKSFADIAEALTGRKEAKGRRKGLLSVGSLFGRLKRGTGHKTGGRP